MYFFTRVVKNLHSKHRLPTFKARNSHDFFNRAVKKIIGFLDEFELFIGANLFFTRKKASLYREKTTGMGFSNPSLEWINEWKKGSLLLTSGTNCVENLSY
jgi:hypothetical protein